MPPNRNRPHPVLAEGGQGTTPALAATREFFWKQIWKQAGQYGIIEQIDRSVIDQSARQW
jgi:hypothetical protein